MVLVLLFFNIWDRFGLCIALLVLCTIDNRACQCFWSSVDVLKGDSYGFTFA